MAGTFLLRHSAVQSQALRSHSSAFRSALLPLRLCRPQSGRHLRMSGAPSLHHSPACHVDAKHHLLIATLILEHLRRVQKCRRIGCNNQRSGDLARPLSCAPKGSGAHFRCRGGAHARGDQQVPHNTDCCSLLSSFAWCLPVSIVARSPRETHPDPGALTKPQRHLLFLPVTLTGGIPPISSLSAEVCACVAQDGRAVDDRLQQGRSRFPAGLSGGVRCRRSGPSRVCAELPERPHARHPERPAVQPDRHLAGLPGDSEYRYMYPGSWDVQLMRSQDSSCMCRLTTNPELLTSSAAPV